MKINLKDIGLGVSDSQPISVPIRVSFKKEEIKELPKITIPIIQKEQLNLEKEIIQLPKIIEPPKQIYGTIHNEQPVIKQEPTQEPNKDSIIDKIETGFGDENTLHKECPKPKWNQHLSKENYLGEFKTEQEKQLARDNLGVYSKEQIDKALRDITHTDVFNFITKSEVEVMITNANYIKANMKKYADYDIPNNLFKI